MYSVRLIILDNFWKVLEPIRVHHWNSNCTLSSESLQGRTGARIPLPFSKYGPVPSPSQRRVIAAISKKVKELHKRDA